MARLIDENGNEIDLDALDPTEAEAETNDEVEDEGQEPEEDHEAESEGQDGEQGDDDEGEIVLTIDGEPVEDEDDDDPDLAETEDDTPTIRKMRQRLKDAKRRERDLKRQVEEAAKAAEPPQEVGERPTLEQYEYDEDAYSEALASYLDRKKEADQKQAAERERVERMEKKFQDKRAAYEVNKGKLNAPGYESAETAFAAMFTPNAQGVVLAAAKEPERMIYALGKSPALAKRLAEMQDDPIEMAAEIGRLESRIQLQPRKPSTKPERRVKGSASTGKSGAAKDFERALDSNDMTEAFRMYKANAARSG